MDPAQDDKLSPQDLAALQEVHLHLQVANDPRADRVGKYLTSIGAPPQKLNADQPGMQPAVDPMAPRSVADKAEETINHYVDAGKRAIETPLSFAHAIGAAMHGDMSELGPGSHDLENKGIIKGTLSILGRAMNPVAPDTGQGPLNRTADTLGGLTGGAVLGEAVPGAEDVQMLKDAPGKLRAASQAAIDKTVNKLQTASPGTKAAAGALPDLVGIASPRAGNALRFAFRGVKGITDVFSQPSAEVPAAISPADASVPASSVSMTQFYPKLATDSMAKIPGTQASSTAEMMGVPKPVVSQVQNVLSDAGAQVKSIITKTEQQYPKKGTFADVIDDAAFSQEANWDLAKTGFRELSKERQKFFANNAPTFNKGQLQAREQVNQILQEASLKAGKILDDAKLPSETRAKLISSIAAPDSDTGAASLGSQVKTAVPAKVDPYEDMTGILEKSLKAMRDKKGK